MKTKILLLIFILTLNLSVIQAAKPQFMVVISQEADMNDTNVGFCIQTLTAYIRSGFKQQLPCAELQEMDDIATMLKFQRMQALLGTPGADEINNIAGGLGIEYLIIVNASTMNGMINCSARCFFYKKKECIAEGNFRNSIQDIIECAHQVARKMIKELSDLEICPFKGTINVTVKTERRDQQVESHPVFCNQSDGLYRRETNINNNSNMVWKLNKSGKNTTGGSVNISLYEETTIEEQNDCAACPNGKQAPRMLNERTVKQANVEGLSNESVFEGIKIDDARTTIKFNEDSTYTIMVEAASRSGDSKLKTETKIEGSCEKENKADKQDKKVDIPLFEIFGPFKGTSFDKVLTGSDTNVRDDNSIKEKTTIIYDFNLKKD
jgi:hypothetical protein